jgi:tRNA(Ile)-lysidine synthetase-like protein
MIKIIKELLSKDQIYYFSVSSGIDSISAFHWMKSKNYSVVPIHFNHKLRVQNDIMEQKFIEFCEKIRAKYIIGRAENSLKTENECRQSRINFYKSIFKNNESIITAHHLNDWIESYLLNCFRGKPNHNPFNLISNFENFNIIHPFLVSRKKDLIQYAERNHLLDYVVEDETNFHKKGSRRNWIRNIILPEMKSNKVNLEKYASRMIEKIIKKTRTRISTI